MVEKEVPELCKRKQIREPPSVPFLWEVKPGMPKKDWKPEKTSVNPPVPQPPVKLVASVPFKWEEMPGKPLPSFSQPPSDSLVLLPPMEIIGSPSSTSVNSQDYDDDDSGDGPEKTLVNPVPQLPIKLVASVPFEWEEIPGKPLPCFSKPPPDSPVPLPPVKFVSSPSSSSVYSQGYDDDDEDYDYGDSVGDGSDGDDEQDGMFELDLESFGFETDESFSSAPSLLANQFLSTVAISTAVPMKETSLMKNVSGRPETRSSQASETNSSTSSYATGTSSLVGASFLKCLFPLLPPDSGFLEKVGYTEKGSLAPVEWRSKDFDHESNCSVVIRRPPTLGELIMMSRRRSYRRKAVQMRNQSFSMEFTKKRAFGCCLLGISNKKIRGLLQGKMKRWPRLKLE